MHDRSRFMGPNWLVFDSSGHVLCFWRSTTFVVGYQIPGCDSVYYFPYTYSHMGRKSCQQKSRMRTKTLQHHLGSFSVLLTFSPSGPSFAGHCWSHHRKEPWAYHRFSCPLLNFTIWIWWRIGLWCVENLRVTSPNLLEKGLGPLMILPGAKSQCANFNVYPFFQTRPLNSDPPSSKWISNLGCLARSATSEAPEKAHHSDHHDR